MVGADQFKIDIGKKLHDFRKAFNITQKDMSEALEMYQSHYSKIEKGEYILSLYRLGILVEKYGLNVYWLLSLDKNMIDYSKKRL